MLKLAVALTVVALLCSSASAQDAAGDAKRAFDSAKVRATRLEKDPKETGEQYCWETNGANHRFVAGYEASKDPAWLDYGVKYYDTLIGRMAEGPDGYKGWIGKYGYDGNYICDVHVGDAILFNGFLQFSELVLKDDALKAKYGEKASLYVELAKKHLIEKWDSRGTWREDGPCAAYTSWDRYGKTGQFKDWQQLPAVNGSNLTLPFNKQNDMGQVCMKIYRITGDVKYRQKATKIFSYMKSRFQYFDDHYLWNYWEAFGPWDVDLAKKTTRHWMGVHPYRNYQSGEISQIVEAYHTGIVFDKTDIQRIINLNLKVMWDGNRTTPRFRNSNWCLPGYKPAPPSTAYPTTAGALWTALSYFDPTIRELASAGGRGGRGPRGGAASGPAAGGAASQPARVRPVPADARRGAPTFDRLYPSLPAEPMEFPFAECKALNVAAALPANFKAGQKTILLCKSPVPGDVEIALYSADGKTKKATLYAGKIEGGMDGLAGICIFEWDGKDPDGKQQVKGPARIRWTYLGQYREQPIHIE